MEPNLTEKSLDTLRSPRRFQWDEIVSVRDDGVEEHWRFERCVAPHGQPRLDSEERKAGDQWIACEWPIQSGWREGSCSRSVARRRYGLSLCWQHADAAFDHVLNQIEDGHCYSAQVEHLARALIAAKYTTFSGDTIRVGAEAFRKVSTDLIRDRLMELAEGATVELEDDWRLNTLLDELIEKRLLARWGNDG